MNKLISFVIIYTTTTFRLNCAPIEQNPNNKILLYKNTQNDNGYHFEYANEDGAQRYETGHYRGNNAALYVQGRYSYFGDDGREYVVNYKAGEQGSEFKGDIIPPAVVLPPQQEEKLPILVNMTTTPFPLLAFPSAALATLAGGGLGK